jgi:outer membrane lipopolysaccharide assembly protein LptE/RlpB
MRTFLAIAVILSLAGCGYKLGNAKPAIFRNVRTLAVPTFKSRALEPRIEVLMADTFIKQLQQDGTYQIVSDDRADAIVYCTLEKAERRQARAVLDNVLATQEFILRLELSYKVIDRVTGVELLKGAVNGNSSFFVTNDLQTDERQAIVNAVQELAVELTGRLTEGF